MKNLFLLATLGIILAFLVPPFQKPDEESHFLRALILSKGAVSCPQTKNVSIEKKYPQLIKEVKSYNLPLHPHNKFSLEVYDKPLLSSATENEKVLFNGSFLCTYPRISYLPQALGIAIGNALGLNAYITFFIGRFLILEVCLLWLLLLIHYSPDPLKKILMLIFAMPMVLHQVSSYGYDGISLMILLTYVVLFFKTYIQKQIVLKDLLLLASILFLFLVSRTGGYEPLVLSMYMLPYKKINKVWYKSILQISLIIALSVVVYFLLKQSSYSPLTLNQLPIGANPGIQIRSLLDPLFALRMLIITTYTRLEFYLISLIGSFGWLEYRIPTALYIIYGIFFGHTILSLRYKKELLFSKFKLLFLTILLITNYVFLLLIFYVRWTPVGKTVVEGIQGRYFIFFLPWIIFLLSQVKQYLFPKFKIPQPNWLTTTIFYLIAFYSIFSISQTVFLRYF